MPQIEKQLTFFFWREFCMTDLTKSKDCGSEKILLIIYL